MGDELSQLFLFSCWKYIFARHSILSGLFCFLRQFHCLLVSMLAEEKLAVTLTWFLHISFRVTIFEDFLLISGFNQLDCDVPHCGFLCFFNLRFVELLEV